MRKIALSFASILALGGLSYAFVAMAQGPAATKPAPAPSATATPSAGSQFKDNKEKISYALGMSLGSNFKAQGLELDPDVFLRGMNDGLSGGKTLMTEDEAKATMMQVQNEMKARMEEKSRMAAVNNKKEGDAFLEANKAKPGVVVLPSGLQYKILTQGTGAKPTGMDTVECNYRGTLIDGTEFDSSYKRNEPAKFQVGRVIRGWTEALQLMPVGSKWQLFIPSTLAYGERGAGPIGPNSTLIFDVELISIQAPPQPGQPAAPAKP